MVRVEVLCDSDDLPLEIPSAIGGHSGVPTAVVEALAEINPGHLVCWRDERSLTIGIARCSKVIVLEAEDVVRLTLDFMRPAKGKGWFALEAQIKANRVPTTLLHSLTYSAEAVDWVMSRRSAIESAMGLKLEICDHGSDY